MFDQVLGQVTWPGCANNVQSGKELGHHQPVQELLAGHVRNVRSGLVNTPAIIRIWNITNSSKCSSTVGAVKSQIESQISGMVQPDLWIQFQHFTATSIDLPSTNWARNPRANASTAPLKSTIASLARLSTGKFRLSHAGRQWQGQMPGWWKPACWCCHSPWATWQSSCQSLQHQWCQDYSPE